MSWVVLVCEPGQGWVAERSDTFSQLFFLWKLISPKEVCHAKQNRAESCGANINRVSTSGVGTKRSY